MVFPVKLVVLKKLQPFIMDIMTKATVILAHNISKLRERHWTQDEFSELLGINIRTLQRYESGEREVPFDLLDKMAGHFKTEVYNLFREETESGSVIQVSVRQALNMMSAVPDELYELAMKLNDPKNEVWDAIAGLLDDEIAYGAKAEKEG
jgi:transcriptional regulator with XRE-family HTH domain